MPLNRLLQEDGFDAEKTANLGVAFDAAWRVLESSDGDMRNRSLAVAARELLAKFMIELARQGESDIDRLVDGALAHWRRAALKAQLDSKC